MTAVGEGGGMQRVHLCCRWRGPHAGSEDTSVATGFSVAQQLSGMGKVSQHLQSNPGMEPRKGNR